MRRQKTVQISREIIHCFEDLEFTCIGEASYRENQRTIDWERVLGGKLLIHETPPNSEFVTLEVGVIVTSFSWKRNNDQLITHVSLRFSPTPIHEDRPGYEIVAVVCSPHGTWHLQVRQPDGRLETNFQHQVRVARLIPPIQSG